MGFKDEATFLESSCALISCAISKHSSRRDEQTAWEVGMIPPGPRNLPSTRVLFVGRWVFRGKVKYSQRDRFRKIRTSIIKEEEVLNESILRSSSCSGFSSAFCDPSLAVKVTSCRRKLINFWWSGRSSGDRTDSDSCIWSTRASKWNGDMMSKMRHTWTMKMTYHTHGVVVPEVWSRLWAVSSLVVRSASAHLGDDEKVQDRIRYRSRTRSDEWGFADK
jgi:hypothetical protein